MWHLPGGFLLKGETLAECQEQLASEFDSKLNPAEGEFLGLVENVDQDPRGHLLHYVVRYINQNIPSEEKKNVFQNYSPKYYSFSKTISSKTGIRLKLNATNHSKIVSWTRR